MQRTEGQSQRWSLPPGRLLLPLEDKAWTGKGRVWAPLLSSFILEEGAAGSQASVGLQGPAQRQGPQ